MDVEKAAREVVDAAYKLHVRLGPGLLETVYQGLLARELERRGLRVERQYPVRLDLDGLHFETALRVDLLVEGALVVEVKSVEQLASVHWRQLLTYLRVMHLPLGLLVNFGGATLKEGVHRVVNDYNPVRSSRLPASVPHPDPAP